MKKYFLIFFFSILVFTKMNAQENRSIEKKEIIKESESKSSIGFVLSHAHIFQGKDATGKKKLLTLPSIGFDYTYQIKKKWAIGLQTDMIIENFKVEGHLGSGEEIERSYPVATALMGKYNATDHWKFTFGTGAEFAKEGNFFLNRFGVEYTAELPKAWEVFGTVSYDIKWKAYDTWILGIGIAKKLRK